MRAARPIALLLALGSVTSAPALDAPEHAYPPPHHAAHHVCASPDLHRAFDPEVAEELLDAASSLHREQRARVLEALARNPAISRETELEIIDSADSLLRDDRARVLAALASTPRYFIPRSRRD